MNPITLVSLFSVGLFAVFYLLEESVLWNIRLARVCTICPEFPGWTIVGTDAFFTNVFLLLGAALVILAVAVISYSLVKKRYGFTALHALLLTFTVNTIDLNSFYIIKSWDSDNSTNELITIGFTGLVYTGNILAELAFLFVLPVAVVMYLYQQTIAYPTLPDTVKRTGLIVHLLSVPAVMVAIIPVGILNDITKLRDGDYLEFMVLFFVPASLICTILYLAHLKYTHGTIYTKRWFYLLALNIFSLVIIVFMIALFAALNSV